ncbi:hypothetical protein [uncultured Thiocystis sp.]|uniref:hypothetical protein n=1 Tax=uncultured Thiocystis sp. TaxID=1202134 RepID=UPI0025DE8CED|nr:hypothetical protein [uncultured Thiocystis sp.]
MSSLTDLIAQAKAKDPQLGADLAVVAEFRDTLYPGLGSTGRVARGDDTPFHGVIKAANHLALKVLTQILKPLEKETFDGKNNVL